MLGDAITSKNKEEERPINCPEERKNETPRIRNSSSFDFDGDDYDDGAGRGCFYWQFHILKVKAE